jgi:hypothetical protein
MTTTRRTNPDGRRTTSGTWLRFGLRLLGLTAALVAGAGAVLASAAITDWTWPGLQAAVTGAAGDRLAQVAAALLLGGAAVAALALAVELLAALGRAAGRRSAAGVSSLVQVALAAALVIGVNVYSFEHYLRIDTTRDRLFTLPPDVVKQLQQLRGETTVVVYQRHRALGQVADKPDPYDFAAERKIVEKVNDLIDQIREFGPQFRVVVLDAEEEGADARLKQEAQRLPGLAAAVEAAPESSIFFCASGRVQRLSFAEFYQLDKTASEQANGGQGNLVLLSQGVEPFVRRVLALEARPPVVGLAVIDQEFSTDSTNEYLKMTGLRKALVAHGFEVRDIILRRNFSDPAAYTLDEDKLDRADATVQVIDAQLPLIQNQLDLQTRRRERTATAGVNELLAELQRELVARPAVDLETARELASLEGADTRAPETAERIRRLVLSFIDGRVGSLKAALERGREERRQAAAELAGLQGRERVVEGQHITDLAEKAKRVFGACDLLIVPRLTLYNLYAGLRVPPEEYRLDEVQAAAIKDYLKHGKPLLACFGPVTEPANAGGPEGGPAEPTYRPDNVELLLNELGIQFSRQTVLYDVESRAFAARRARNRPGQTADVPGLTFRPEGSAGPLNPVAGAMLTVERSVDGRLSIQPRHPRPVYYASTRGPAAVQAEFLFTDPASWNESKPFPTRDRPAPRFDPPEGKDAGKAVGLDEERRGPFPVGVAVQTTTPADWDDRYAAHLAARAVLSAAPTGLDGPLSAAAESFLPEDRFVSVTSAKPPARTPVRVAAIGHGGLFVGDLSPAKEALLLTLCNWLLGRDDRLPRADLGMWQYPRVEMSDRDRALWHWGTFLGLPALCAYLGLVVLRFRQVR